MLLRDTPHSYTPSKRVVTDRDRFVNYTRGAEAIGDDEGERLAGRAFALNDGAPFRSSSGYSWRSTEASLLTSSDSPGEPAPRESDSRA